MYFSLPKLTGVIGRMRTQVHAMGTELMRTVTDMGNNVVSVHSTGLKHHNNNSDVTIVVFTVRSISIRFFL